MRRKRAYVLGIMSVIIMLLTWKQTSCWESPQVPVVYVDSVLGIAVVEDLAFLEDRKYLKAGSNPGVFFENVLLPYDVETNTLFLSQSAETDEWVGGLSANDGFFLCTTQNDYWHEKQAAIRDGCAFWVWLVNEECYYKLKLVVSGMPVISIETESKEQIKMGEELAGTICIFNPDVGCDRYEIHQSYMSYHIKGNTSTKLPKKGYALKLQDYRGQKVDASLLGMRSDNSWKLNALYTDSSRIREKTAAQIWEQFSMANPELKQDGPRLEYVELIINDRYMGVYCLVEPVDEDKLGLDKNDILYKVVSWRLPSNDDFATAVAEEAGTVPSIRIQYPKEIADYDAVWYPMWDYNERFYHNPELDYEEALSKVNVGNLSDVFMFLMVTSASDNDYKNMYYAASVTGEKTYIMKQVPWDLDYTFGNIFDGGSKNFAQFVEDYKCVYGDSTLPRLKFENIEEIGHVFWQRWMQYRKTFLDTECILRLLQENRDYLVETGAMQREKERWPEVTVSSDIDEILSYQKKRMDWLDEYFAGWVAQ